MDSWWYTLSGGRLIAFIGFLRSLVSGGFHVVSVLAQNGCRNLPLVECDTRLCHACWWFCAKHLVQLRDDTTETFVSQLGKMALWLRQVN